MSQRGTSVISNKAHLFGMHFIFKTAIMVQVLHREQQAHWQVFAGCLVTPTVTTRLQEVKPPGPRNSVASNPL